MELVLVWSGYEKKNSSENKWTETNTTSYYLSLHKRMDFCGTSWKKLIVNKTRKDMESSSIVQIDMEYNLQKKEEQI